MNVWKIVLALLGILLCSYLAFLSLASEKEKRELRDRGKVLELNILELKCGKQASIKFHLEGREINERIYLSKDECAELKKQAKIELKVGDDGTFIFAEDSYNDWSEAESLAIVLISAFFIFLIIYRAIWPEIQKKK